MNDTGQTGSTYTAFQWNPSGYLRINGAAPPVDYNGWASVRTADGTYDLQFGEGANAGQSGGFGVVTRLVSNVNNFCRLSVGVSTAYAMAISCAGTYGSAIFNSIQPISIQTSATTLPNLQVAPQNSLMTGTVPHFQIKPSGSAGTCPLGGCGEFVSSDGSFAGYIGLWDYNGTRKFGVKPAGLEFFARSTLISGIQGSTGTNLLSCTGTLANGHLIVADANGNCADGGIPPSGGGPGVNTGSVTIAAASGTGSTGTAACITVCNGYKGRILITPSGTGIGAGDVATITFGTAYADTNYVCVVTQNYHNDGVDWGIKWTPTSTTVMTLTAQAPDAFSQEFDYHCFQ
jgi:hypothetical protein